MTARTTRCDQCADRSLLQGDCFSNDGKYRYALWRRWREDGPHYCFILLNPSLADRNHADNTVTRCERFAIRWGGRGLDVVNLFGWVSPYPEVLPTLKNAIDAGHGENDYHIHDAVQRSDYIILGWGDRIRFPALTERIQRVRALLQSCNVSALSLTKSGQPRHPLYLLANSKPIPYRWPNTPAL